MWWCRGKDAWTQESNGMVCMRAREKKGPHIIVFVVLCLKAFLANTQIVVVAGVSKNRPRTL